MARLLWIQISPEYIVIESDFINSHL